MNGWSFDVKKNVWYNTYNLIETRIHPEIGHTDEYWMNSVEKVISEFHKPTSTGLTGIGLVKGVNFHWPSIQKGHKIQSFGYDSFDPMI